VALSSAIDVYDTTAQIQPNYRLTNVIALDPKLADVPIVMAVHGHWLLFLPMTAVRSIHFVDVSPQRMEKKGGLVISPASYPPASASTRRPAGSASSTRDMTVVGDRLFVADGKLIRCFALSADEKAAAPTLTPLSVSPIHSAPLLRVSAVECGAAGVRLFVGTADGVITCAADSKSANDWRVVGAGAGLAVLTAARGRVLVAPPNLAEKSGSDVLVGRRQRAGRWPLPVPVRRARRGGGRRCSGQSFGRPLWIPQYPKRLH
jgi:hypothetical protein